MGLGCGLLEGRAQQDELQRALAGDRWRLRGRLRGARGELVRRAHDVRVLHPPGVGEAQARGLGVPVSGLGLGLGLGLG